MFNEILNEFQNEFQNNFQNKFNGEINNVVKEVIEVSKIANIISGNIPPVSRIFKISIYPEKYESISHITKEDKMNILGGKQPIQLDKLFDMIWNEQYNKNFFKLNSNYQVIYFFNYDSIYEDQTQPLQVNPSLMNALYETFAYKNFFNRMIEILYEFVYDLYRNSNITNGVLDDSMKFYINKIRKLENEGHYNHIKLIKDCMKYKSLEIIYNRNAITEYETIVKNDYKKTIRTCNDINISNDLSNDLGNNLGNHFLEIKKYVNEYNKKKSRIDHFKNPYITLYDKNITDIEKLDFASLYLIPDFLK